MRLPSDLVLLSLQRTAFRFFKTDKMMDFLSVYYGASKVTYPRSWAYRTIIAMHRTQQLNDTTMLRKGYGPDWKCLHKVMKDGKLQRVPDHGLSIKKELQDTIRTGKLPYFALKQGAVLMRQVEQETYIAMKVQENVRKRRAA